MGCRGARATALRAAVVGRRGRPAPVGRRDAAHRPGPARARARPSVGGPRVVARPLRVRGGVGRRAVADCPRGGPAAPLSAGRAVRGRPGVAGEAGRLRTAHRPRRTRCRVSAGRSRVSAGRSAAGGGVLLNLPLPEPLPPVESMSAQQLRGTRCVWCSAELTATTAVDLGARPEYAGASVFIFPRRCRACPEEALRDSHPQQDEAAPAPRRGDVQGVGGPHVHV